MIIVSLLGMDSYQAIEDSKKLHKSLVALYGCSEDDLIFFAPESFLIHDGTEQTSFLLNVTVEAPLRYKNKEKEVKDEIVTALTSTAIHFRVLFTYFDEAHEYLAFDPTYPKYMTPSNTVKAENGETENEKQDPDDAEEPYMGDIIGEFDAYLKKHPGASKEEIYAALTGIRKDVTAAHEKK